MHTKVQKGLIAIAAYAAMLMPGNMPFQAARASGEGYGSYELPSFEKYVAIASTTAVRQEQHLHMIDPLSFDAAKEHIEWHSARDTLVGGLIKGEPDYNWERLQRLSGQHVRDIRSHYGKEKKYAELADLIGTPGLGLGGSMAGFEDRLHTYKHVFASAVERQSEKHGVAIALEDVLAIASAESRMDPRTLSWAGYAGIMMLGPELYKGSMWSDGIPCPAINPFTDEAIERGVEFYARLLDEFKDEDLALLAYNRGPTAVRTAVKYAGSTMIDEVIEARDPSGKRIINLEGREYPEKVKRYRRAISDHLAGKGRLANLVQEYAS